MNDKVLISGRQAVYLVIFSIIPASVLFIPGDPSAIIGHDAWISIIPATFLAAVMIFYPLADMGKRFPGETIIQYSEKIAGKYAGRLFSVMIIYYYFQLHCWTLRSFGEFMSVFLPETPVMALYFTISLITVYAAKNGLEVIGRCSEFVFPFGFMFLAVISLLSLEDVNAKHLRPVLDSGMGPLLRATLAPLDWLATGVTFGAVTAFIADQSKIKRVGLIAAGVSGLVLIVFSLVSIAVFGPLVEDLNFSYLALAGYVKVGGFLERIEVLFVVAWVAWIFMAIAFSSYVTSLSLAQFMRLKDYRFLILPETVLAVGYSIYEYKSLIEMSYLFSIAHLYYLIFSLGVPFLLWLIARARFWQRG